MSESGGSQASDQGEIIDVDTPGGSSQESSEAKTMVVRVQMMSFDEFVLDYDMCGVDAVTAKSMCKTNFIKLH